MLGISPEHTWAGLFQTHWLTSHWVYLLILLGEVRVFPWLWNAEWFLWPHRALCIDPRRRWLGCWWESKSSSLLDVIERIWGLAEYLQTWKLQFLQNSAFVSWEFLFSEEISKLYRWAWRKPIEFSVVPVIFLEVFLLSQVTLSHFDAILDNFYFIGNSMKDVLNLYTKVAGRPMLPPVWGLYLGDSDCYNNARHKMTTSTALSLGFCQPCIMNRKMGSRSCLVSAKMALRFRGRTIISTKLNVRKWSQIGHAAQVHR